MNICCILNRSISLSIMLFESSHEILNSIYRSLHNMKKLMRISRKTLKFHWDFFYFSLKKISFIDIKEYLKCISYIDTFICRPIPFSRITQVQNYYYFEQISGELLLLLFFLRRSHAQKIILLNILFIFFEPILLVILVYLKKVHYIVQFWAIY